MKKSVLHIANKNAIGGGIGTVLNYLREGTNSSKGFEADTLLTTYDSKQHKPGAYTLQTKDTTLEDELSEGELERLIEKYDVIHVHGVPHYGILEKLHQIKNRGGKKPVIINTAHSSVKQEFLAQYDNASKNPDLKEEFDNLRYLKEKNILGNPFPFCDTYWGSAIYRQEQIMTISDSVQHMNEAYKSDILKEYSAKDNAAKHVVIPNGVKVVEDTVPRPKKKRILFMGRFAKDKGIDEFVDAIPKIFEVHPDTEIKFVGGDESGKLVEEYKNKVKKKIQEYFNGKTGHDGEKYFDRIQFTGWVTDPEIIKEHYRWTDYLIVPSSAESFSLVASEALMHKRIPIMTKTKALDDLYISKGIAYGIEYEKRNGEGIAETVNEVLLQDASEKSDKMAEKGRKYAMKHYAFDKMIKSQLSSYRKVLKNAKLH